MGKRGPKPKPPELEARQGFPGRHKGQTESKLAAARHPPPPADSPSVQPSPVDIPPAPPFLETHPAALIIWRELWSAADAQNRLRLRETDAAFLARYCWKRARVEAWMARPKIRTKYTTTTTTGGKKEVADVEYTEMRALMNDLTADEQQIGLTPRARVDLANKTIDSPRDPAPLGKSGAPQPAAPADPYNTTPATPPRPASPVGLLAATATPPPKSAH